MSIYKHNFDNVSTVYNNMIHNKQEPIGSVFGDRQNDSTWSRRFQYEIFHVAISKVIFS